jgi:hypothetical protein
MNHKKKAMKKIYLVLIFLSLINEGFSQKKWDGNGGDNNWSTSSNWFPDGVPLPGDLVILDNSLYVSSYTVLLPSGAVNVSVQSLQVLPSMGNNILLHLPSGNVASPGLQITGSGESLELGNGATLRNSSGAVSGEVILLAGLMRISNGGRYLHNTPRGNATLIDKLSIAAGTELGIFEFDVPGTAGYTVSLTGNTFGSLVFSATAAGGLKSYSGSGTSTLQINGNWIINPGTTLTSTLSANILLRGELDIRGNLNLHPVTSGGTGRSIFFTGTNNIIRGTGNLSLNNNFRNMEVFSGSICSLEKGITLPLAVHTFLVNSGAILHTRTFSIDGNGTFTVDTDATLGIGLSEGITISGNNGNIRTLTRNYNTGANYFYEGDGNQETGNGLPGNINGLGINKTSGNLQLTKTVSVSGTIYLQSGLINTSDAISLIFTGNDIFSPLNQFGEINAGWEKSFINGPMKWETNIATTQIIPIGKSPVFAPVKMQKLNTGFAAYLLEYFPTPYVALVPVSSPPLDHISKIEYWEIKTDPASTSPDAGIGLSWRPESGVGNTITDRNDLRITQFENRGMGLRWEELSGPNQTSFNGNYGQIISNQAISNFSVYTLASASKFNILPISGIRLNSFLRNEKVDLIWAIEGDELVSHYTIEKSKDGRTFSSIEIIDASHDKKNQSHNFTDINPYPGLNYYRIRVNTVTDSTQVSGISFQFLSQKTEPMIYPNPVIDQLTLYFPEASSIFECMIVNYIGLLTEKKFFLQGKYNSISVKNLPSGRYSLILKHQNKRFILPFIKG